MWVDERKKVVQITKLNGNLYQRIQSLTVIAKQQKAAIQNQKQLNTSLRLSRNGLRGNCELQKRNLNAKLNHANSTVALLMDEVKNITEQTKVSDSIASKLMIKCSNQEKRIVLLKEDVKKLRDIIRLSANTDQLQYISPSEDLPIGTKFMYGVAKLEVQLDKGSCEPCFFAEWHSDNGSCSEAHRCYYSARADKQSIIFKQLN